eukprot:m.189427 g.189427  ORF g.189427 m.189427 type:complete len:324 (+) comp32372_c9_seq1:266-1237(+)
MDDEAGCRKRPSGHIVDVESKFPNVETTSLEGHEGGVMCVRFSKTGTYCLTGGKDRFVKLWNPLSGICIKSYKGHASEVNDVASSLDNSRIISGSKDKSVFLWDVASGNTITRFRGHSSPVNCVKFNKDSMVILSGSYDATVKLWDMRSNMHDPIMTLDDAKDSVTSIDVSDWQVLSGSVDGEVRCYDIRMGAMNSDYLKDPVTSVSFSHDKNCILASTLNSTIRLLDKESGELLADYKGHKNDEYKVDSRLSHNDAYVVSGSESGEIYFWDLVQGTIKFKKKAHTSVIASLDYHPSKPMMLSASVDGVIKVWQCEGASDEDE